jgi:hypothetical protein
MLVLLTGGIYELCLEMGSGAMIYIYIYIYIYTQGVRKIGSGFQNC